MRTWIILLLIGLCAAAASSSAEPLVRKKTDSYGPWLEFVKPMLQERDGLKVSVIGVRHVRPTEESLAESEGIEVIISTASADDWASEGTDLSDETGHTLRPRSYFWRGENTELDGPRTEAFCYAAELPPPNSKLLKELTVVAKDQPPVVEHKVGPLTPERLKTPVVQGDYAIELADWIVDTWPGHEIFPIYDDELDRDQPQHELTNDKLYLRLRFYYVDGRENRDNDPRVLVYDEKGDQLRMGNAGRIAATSPAFDYIEPYFGFQVAQMTRERKKSSKASAGAYVTVVDPYGPSAEGGLKHGDVIVEWGSKSLRDARLIDTFTTPAVAGVPVDLTVVRNGKRLVLPVTPIPDPEWQGLEQEAAAAWQRLKAKLPADIKCIYGAAQTCSKQPISKDFGLNKIELTFREQPKPTKQLEFKFRDIPIPEEFWEQ